jgi:hypothetical protein
LPEESKVQNKEEHSRVSVRIGNFQVEVEGTYANIKTLMEKEVLDFIGKLQRAVGETPTPITPEVSEEAKEAEAIPPLGRPSTTIEALSTLFNTEWGEKPRTLADVMNSLEANGLYYKKAVVAKVLVDLIKRKELRRLGSRGSFQYVKT